MSEEAELKALQEQVDAEKRVVASLQAEYNKALEELRILFQRQAEADLSGLSAELDAHAHNFE